MNADPAHLQVTIGIDHGQVYIGGHEPTSAHMRALDPNFDRYLHALDDAHHSDRFVGVSCGMIDLLTPIQWNFEAPLAIEIWAAEPPEETLAGWEHTVDVDLDAPLGRLWFEASGGGGCVDYEIPAGSYRARVSGRGYTEHAATRRCEGTTDSYRLQLWPRTQERPPELVTSWPGWTERN